MTSFSRYEAHFKDGLKNGCGVLITDDGDRIHGEWVNDTFQTYYHRDHGQLVIGNSVLVNAKFADGREYLGEHLNFEMFHGFGVETVKTPDGVMSFRGEVLKHLRIEPLTLDQLMSILVGSTQEGPRDSSRHELR